MEVVADISSLKTTEPEVLGILYGTSAARRDLRGLHSGVRPFARLRLVTQLLVLRIRWKNFVKYTKAMTFDLPSEREVLEECDKTLAIVIDMNREFISNLKDAGLTREIPERWFLSDFTKHMQNLEEIHVAWSRLLADIPARYELADLIERITPENRHAILEWGAPVGKEIW